MKFIHAADLHLGSPFKGLTGLPNNIKKAVMVSISQSFDRLVNDAISEQVDFIILAGDEFDNSERSLRSQLYLKNKFEQLKEHDISVYLIYGNHDFLTSANNLIGFPDNVTVFGPEIETKYFVKNNEKIAITGFSYDRNHITQDVAKDYPVRDTSADYQIGILHGSISGDVGDYAPFTITELINKGYDYWALGHIHKRDVLSDDPYIIYPGNIQGRHRNEPGEKGYYLVTESNKETDAKFVSTAPIIWQNISLSVKDIKNLNQLITKIEASTENKHNTLIELTLTDMDQLKDDLKNTVVSDELLDSLQNSVSGKHFNFIYKIIPEYSKQISYQTIDEQYWQIASEKIFTQENLNKNLGTMVRNDAIREYCQRPDFLKELQKDTMNVINNNNVED